MRARGILTVFLLGISSASYSTATAEIDGALRADKPATLRGALVILHNIAENDPSFHSYNWEARVDPDGQFSLRVLPGCYDVFISAVWLDPYATRVCVPDGAKAKLKAKMRESRNVWLAED